MTLRTFVHFRSVSNGYKMCFLSFFVIFYLILGKLHSTPHTSNLIYTKYNDTKGSLDRKSAAVTKPTPAEGASISSVRRKKALDAVQIIKYKL